MDFTGRNALPEGLGFSLALDLPAMTNFVNLSDGSKIEVVSYIKDAKDGDEAKYRVDQVVRNLHLGRPAFYDPNKEQFK